MKADWSSSAASARPVSAVGGEHLVPVVADPAAGPAIPAAAGQTHRVGVGRSEERLGGGSTPVDQQLTTRAVGEAEPTDVHRLGGCRAPTMCPRQRSSTEPTQGAQPSGQPVDLHVPLHRLLADAAGRLALGIEAVGQLGDRLLEALRDGREMLLVAGDQRRVGLGGEAGREGQTRWWSRGSRHQLRSGIRHCGLGRYSRTHRRQHDRPPRLDISAGLASASDSAARPGSCRKPPVRYTLRVEDECAR